MRRGLDILETVLVVHIRNAERLHNHNETLSFARILLWKAFFQFQEANSNAAGDFLSVFELWGLVFIGKFCFNILGPTWPFQPHHFTPISSRETVRLKTCSFEDW